jgi:hypothetical protein
MAMSVHVRNLRHPVWRRLSDEQRDLLSNFTYTPLREQITRRTELAVRHRR